MLNDDLSLSAVDIEVSGRKIPLECIREKINFKHKEYFRIHTDNQLEQLTKTEIINELIRIDEYSILLGDNEKSNEEKNITISKKTLSSVLGRWVKYC